jgi:hypothetical protein
MLLIHCAGNRTLFSVPNAVLPLGRTAWEGRCRCNPNYIFQTVVRYDSFSGMTLVRLKGDGYTCWRKCDQAAGLWRRWCSGRR